MGNALLITLRDRKIELKNKLVATQHLNSNTLKLKDPKAQDD